MKTSCESLPNHRRRSRVGWVLLIVLSVPGAARSSENEPAAAPVETIPAEQRDYFEKKIRPVLVKHCYACHSADAEEPGGKLRLDSREAMLVGGESGPTLVAGSPDESLLIQALRYEALEMPPEAPLSEAVVNDFVYWVKLGSPDPRTESLAAADEPSPDEVDPALWSFRPVTTPAVPDARNADWGRDPIDRFILARVEAAGLAPTDDAAPETLVRRLYFDLLGLSPTIEQVEEFLKDHQQHGQQAMERLVDSLLASSQFGERWGRHWLDVARFGESNGNDGLGRNPTFPHAWRYRDYVIRAMNDDVPYDRFLTEQIAGDLLPADSPAERDRQLVATAFLALTAKPAKAMNENFDMDVIADQIDVVSTAVMGLSVACARCHDHKHDPIPTSDYYALAGIFQSTETLWGLAAKENLTAPETPLHPLQAAPPVMPRDEPTSTDSAKNGATKNAAPAKALAMGVRERGKPADCKINIKGESKSLGASVPRGFLSACGNSESMPAIDPQHSGRLQLAQWLTSGEHPQTARVMVNRIWLHLFGQAIVGTPDDFGVYGNRPTHPELLDHLSARFITEGWSVKRMIRSIVLSRTYQLSSQCDAQTREADPDNRWLCRHNRRRMDAESLRDSILQASGELDRQPGQGSLIQHLDVLVNKAGNLHQPSNHRSVYLCMLRNSPPPELAAFDFPDGMAVAGKRNVTTLPTQSLFLFNSPFLVEQSHRFAERVIQAEADDTARVGLAYRRALQREPSADEVARTLAFIHDIESELVPERPEDTSAKILAWASVCQVLLAASEFRYID